MSATATDVSVTIFSACFAGEHAKCLEIGPPPNTIGANRVECRCACHTRGNVITANAVGSFFCGPASASPVRRDPGPLAAAAGVPGGPGGTRGGEAGAGP